MPLLLDVVIAGASETATLFGKLADDVHQKIVAKVYGLALLVENRAKQKLSGEVLNVRTGQLRANVQSDVSQQDEGVVGRVFVTRNVKYAAIHEFGGVIKHPGGTAYWIDPKTGMAEFISNKSRLANLLPRTKPHPIPMPERSYMRSSLTEYKDEIINQLSAGVRAAIAENQTSPDAG